MKKSEKLSKKVDIIATILASVNMVASGIGFLLAVGYMVRGVITDDYKWGIIIGSVLIPTGIILLSIVFAKLTAKSIGAKYNKALQEEKAATHSAWDKRLAEMKERYNKRNG